MATFFVDYENESDRLLDGILFANLKYEDEVFIFYSNRSGRISMNMHEILEQVHAKKTYIKAETGTPNALDFQLVTYLGACIHNKPLKEYYIVSNDCGFDCVCKFWSQHNVLVRRISRFGHYVDVDNNFLE